MNPGPTLGWLAVGAAYTVVLAGLLIFVSIMSAKRKRLAARREELEANQ
jgi:hypothetical protein